MKGLSGFFFLLIPLQNKFFSLIVWALLSLRRQQFHPARKLPSFSLILGVQAPLDSVQLIHIFTQKIPGSERGKKKKTHQNKRNRKHVLNISFKALLICLRKPVKVNPKVWKILTCPLSTPPKAHLWGKEPTFEEGQVPWLLGSWLSEMPLWAES